MAHQRIGIAHRMAMVAFAAGCQQDSSGPQLMSHGGSRARMARSTRCGLRPPT